METLFFIFSWPLWLYLIFPFLGLILIIKSVQNKQENLDNWPPITICVAFRDEEKNLPFLIHSFSNLDYPADSLELIFIDDGSKDNSAKLIENAVFKHKKTIIQSSGAGKKTALTKGINLAQSEIILCTDADCSVPPQWCKEVARCFSKHAEVQFISMPLSEQPQKSFLSAFSAWDVWALSLSGLGFLSLGWPILCNGANLAFKKSAWLKVGGYQAFSGLASGDDVFLMRSIAKKYPQSVFALTNKATTVFTLGTNDWHSFLNRRLRWAGKWKAGFYWPQIILALFIFLTNLIAFLSLPLLFFFPFSQSLWSILILKTGSDFLFLALTALFYSTKPSWLYLPFSLILYPIYALVFGIWSNLKTDYVWKGRTTK